ncbi:MAG: ribonuclease III, partial [Bacteroidales bacterium]|nr:ribonuclease III [Bacteroidales bacterium]
LSVVIAQWLYESFPEASEGELTRWRASLVKGSTLAKVARKLELGECLVLGGGELKSGGHRRDSILADAVEALLGAVFLEAGLEGSRERVHDWFAELLEAITLGSDEKDAKTRLQEYLQSRGKPLPVYKVMQVAGDQHDQIFTVSCSIRDLDGPVTAQAPSRKKAEKRAAEQALSQLLGH